MIRALSALSGLVILLGVCRGQNAGPVPFQKIQLNPQFYSEGINFGDLNRDGKQDIIAGHSFHADARRRGSRLV